MIVKDNKLQIRKFKNGLLFWTVCILSGLTAIPLLAILGEVFVKGWEQLGWSFITEATPNAYKAMQAMEAGETIPGGIANGIVGTFLMLFLAAIVAIPVGIFCGICLSEYRGNWFATIVSYLTDLLQGTPSIIIGIITYIWVVVPMKGYSAASTHNPFHRRNNEDSSRNTQGGRSCTRRKLLESNASGHASISIRKYIHRYSACYITCSRRNSTTYVYSSWRRSDKLEHGTPYVGSTIAYLGILQRS